MNDTNTNAAPRPFDPNERTYKQSMLMKSLFGWWPPRGMTKKLASELIDLGFTARNEGKDKVSMNPEMTAQLLAFNSEYITKWLEDGCPVLKGQYTTSGKPSRGRKPSAPKPSTPKPESKPEPTPAPTAPTATGSDAELDEADLLRLVEIVNVLKTSKRKIAIVATLLDVK